MELRYGMYSLCDKGNVFFTEWKCLKSHMTDDISEIMESNEFKTSVFCVRKIHAQTLRSYWILALRYCVGFRKEVAYFREKCVTSNEKLSKILWDTFFEDSPHTYCTPTLEKVTLQVFSEFSFMDLYASLVYFFFLTKCKPIQSPQFS